MVNDFGKWKKTSDIKEFRNCLDAELFNSSAPRAALVNWASTGSDNGLLSAWRQAITWNDTGSLPIGPVGTNLVKFESKY